jgi:hypothetical protein
MDAPAPLFHKYDDVEVMLNLGYQTIYRLCRAGILVKTGRGQGVLISDESVQALISWMEKGGDKWDAPRMRANPPDVISAPVARAVSGRTRKTAAGGMQSASTASNTNTGRLTSKPPLRVLNSLKLNLTTE